MFIIAGENRWHLALNVNKAEQFKIIEKHAIHILPKTIYTSELDTTEETGFINYKITRYNVNVYFYTLINLKNVSIPL